MTPLKPCPFCGKVPEVSGYCACYGHRVMFTEEWNSAWAHEIIETEQANANYWEAMYKDLREHYLTLKKRCEKAGIPTNYGGPDDDTT